MSIRFGLRWGDGADIQSPELRATWCSLEIEVNGQTVTVLQSDSGGPRTSVNVSAYPLAEWLVENWFLLLEYQHASVQFSDGLSLRGASDGMAWPDMSFAPEGDLIRCRWRSRRLPFSTGLTYITSGDEWVKRRDFEAALSDLVWSVVARLVDEGIAGTYLQLRWDALNALDAEEREFAVAAAHLGLDSFVSDETQDRTLLSAAERLPQDLLIAVLDSTSARDLGAAVEWLEEARARIELAPTRVTPGATRPPQGLWEPWNWGYDAARALRDELGSPSLTLFPINDFVGVARADGASGGIEGYSGTVDDRTGLVLPGDGVTAFARFAQARALGYWYMFRQEASVLPPTHRSEDKASRAFAAELLLPSEDLRVVKDQVGGRFTEQFMDALAAQYDVSPVLVRRQVQNHAMLG